MRSRFYPSSPAAPTVPTPERPWSVRESLHTRISVQGAIVAQTEADCQAGVDAYLRSYHPAGYSTSVGKPCPQPDGSWLASFRRSASCD